MGRAWRVTRIVLLATVVLFAFPANGFSFGGAGTGPIPPTTGNACDACHILPGHQSDTPRGPHKGYAGVTTQCGTCHWTAHAAAGDKLLFASTRAAVCRACHDGTGGLGVYVLTSFGVVPGASHRAEATSVVPGGSDSTGGSATRTFGGAGGTLTCDDCHSPHGNNTVSPFYGTRARMFSSLNVPVSDRLLKRRPTGAETTVTEYGSDWCMACHKGRGSGGSIHNHPVDSKATNATPAVYDRVLTGSQDWTVPMAVSQDSQRVFVYDTGNWRVQSFTSGGTFVTSWATPAGGIGGGLALTRDRNSDGQPDLASADALFDSGHQPFSTQTGGSAGTWNSSLFSDIDRPITGVADLYAGNGLVALQGEFIKPVDQGGGPLYLVGAWSRPMGIATQGSRYFVVDAGGSKVVAVSSGGAVLYSYTGPAAAPGRGPFKNPMAIACGPDARIYVVDTGNNRIQVFDADGAGMSFVRSWGTTGTGPAEFDRPAGIAVAPNGDVYVADRGNHRIQWFTSAGVFVGQWGSRGTGNGQFGFGRAVPKPIGAPALVGQSTGYFGGSWEGMLMADPRLTAQDGHGPICQQCHADSGDPGTLANGVPVAKPRTYLRFNGGWKYQTDWFTETTTPNPLYPAFPHETANDNMIVRTGDGLCLDCHLPANLP